MTASGQFCRDGRVSLIMGVALACGAMRSMGAGHTAGSDVNASAVARTGRDATSHGQPAAA
jgi:hypothetical protein